MSVEQFRQRLARHTQALRRVSDGKAERFETQLLDDLAGMRRVISSLMISPGCGGSCILDMVSHLLACGQW
jgi:hypothetical protein